MEYLTLLLLAVLLPGGVTPSYVSSIEVFYIFNT